MEYLQTGYGLDENGYILSDVSANKISSVFNSCIRESVDQMITLYPNQLHSVYIYGSVARGDATEVKSDLDLLALFNNSLDYADKMKVKELSTELSEAYVHLVRDVGIAATDYDHVMNPRNYYEQAFLKELCVCVYGEDLRERFGPYKLN